MRTKRKYTRRNLVKSIKKIALVDDHPAFRLGLAGLLRAYDDIEISFEAANGVEALDKLRSCTPDVILMDIEMPVMDGLQTTELIKKHYPGIKILMLTTYDNQEFISHVMRLGCNGYLLKDYTIEIIAEAIYRVFDNKFFFRENLSKGLLKKITRSAMTQKPAYGEVLTEREKEIVQLICGECNNREISEKLCISVRTVERHRENIQLKMGVKNTVGLVMYAMRNGLVK